MKKIGSWRRYVLSLIVVVASVVPQVVAEPRMPSESTQSSTRFSTLERQAFFSLDGLTFGCDSCRRVSDEECEYQPGRLTLRISCALLLERLVQERPVQSAEAFPSVQEIVRYLLRETNEPLHVRRSPATRTASLLVAQLLRRSEEEFLRSFSGLWMRYPEAVLALLRTDEVSNAVLQQARRSITGVAATDIRARSVLAVKLSIPLAEVVAGIDARDASSERRTLALMQEVLTEEGSALAADIKVLQHHAAHCRIATADPSYCPGTLFESLPRELGSYLQRLRAEALVEWIGQVDPSVFTLLQTVERSSPTLVRSSPSLERLTVQALVAVGQRKSETPLLLAELSPRYPELQLSGRGTLWLLLLFGSLVSTVIGYAAVARKRKSLRKVRRVPVDDELHRLTRYFNLPRNCSEEELGRAFRRRARVLHPDLNPTGAPEFMRMNEKYRRAKELLQSNQIS